MMRIYSIRERPEYIPAMLESLENHWPACMPWIQKHMEQVRRPPSRRLHCGGEGQGGGRIHSGRERDSLE